MVSAYPNRKDLNSHIDTDNTNTKSTDKGKNNRKKVINKPCVSYGKWIAIRWLTLNIPQSADME